MIIGNHLRLLTIYGLCEEPRYGPHKFNFYTYEFNGMITTNKRRNYLKNMTIYLILMLKQ